MGGRQQVPTAGVGRLARRIRSRRKRLRLSIQEVADRAGMAHARVSDLERGVGRDPRLSTLRRVARALETVVGELV